MAAIALSDCTVDNVFTDGVKIVQITTPSTADDGDTIDVSSLFQSGCVAICVNNTDGSNLSDTSASGGWSQTITLPGSTDDETREIIAIGV